MDWNITGHEWAAKLLAQHIAHGEVRHAYLFAGPPGIGRRTLALRFAQALNCTQPPEPGQPCLSCRTCQQIERMQHTDLVVAQAETVGGTFKVEQVREVTHALSFSPYQAAYRVALLLRFQEANPSAQNALLKTLEEPAERAVLLLTADAPDALLPTIVSRCEVLRLRPMAVDGLAQALQTRWSLPAAEAQTLAHLSGGRVGAALRYQRDPDLLEKRLFWAAEALRLLRCPLRERFAFSETNTKKLDREGLRELFQIWLSFWRDVLIVSCGAQTPLVNLPLTGEVQRLADEIDPATARQCALALETAVARLDANINARMQTDVLLLDWPRLR